MSRSVLFFALATLVHCTFYQLQCSDSGCKKCTRVSFPEEVCVPTAGGGSAIIFCGAQYVTQEVWANNAQCSGAATITTRSPLNVCTQSSQAGTYFVNECSSKRTYVRPVGGEEERSALLYLNKYNVTA